jgi:RNA polymerase sigma-70 factor (ECF subfamily)
VAPAAEEIARPAEPAARRLLDQYIAAFQNADAPALERLLCQDATLEATPFKTWFAGNRTCVPYLRRHVLGSPGDWLMRPSSANGQPAALAYTRDRDGAYQPYGIVVLTVTGAGISRIVSFHQPGLVARLPSPSPSRRPEAGGCAASARPGAGSRPPGC